MAVTATRMERWVSGLYVKNVESFISNFLTENSVEDLLSEANYEVLISEPMGQDDEDIIPKPRKIHPNLSKIQVLISTIGRHDSFPARQVGLVVLVGVIATYWYSLVRDQSGN